MTYNTAEIWLEHNPLLFGKKTQGHNFIHCFDKLYKISWAELTERQNGLAELWELWIGFAKPIRNHLAHAQQTYSEEPLNTALAINEMFLMRLDKAMKSIVGALLFSGVRGFF